MTNNYVLIKVKKLNKDAKMPVHGSAAAAGYDVFANLDKAEEWIPPHATKKIGTGLSFEIPEGYWVGIFARSGLATKEGLRPANCVGVVDSDYRGEIIVAVHNDNGVPKKITKDTKIAQLIVLPSLYCDFQETEELNDTDRGEGGFGSTGK